METKEKLNSKILSITMTIKEQHPELLKYLDEMPVTIPNEEHPDVTIEKLNNYYESLKGMLDKYINGGVPVQEV